MMTMMYYPDKILGCRGLVWDRHGFETPTPGVCDPEEPFERPHPDTELIAFAKHVEGLRKEAQKRLDERIARRDKQRKRDAMDALEGDPVSED